MIKNHTRVALTLALVLLGGIAEVSALTLGQIRGAALLGQPLQLSVQVQADGEDELNAACFAADVFYGDVRIESGRVTVITQPNAAMKSAVVRIATSARVDEPMVTVYLKAVCEQKTSRRYVLLSDLVSDTAPSATQEVSLAMQPAVAMANVESVPTAGTRNASTGSNVAHKTVAKRVATAKTTAKVDSGKPHVQSASVVPKVQSIAPHRSHLKLAPLDMSVERDLILKSSGELASSPAEDLQKRVEALAMWHALNASAEDVLRDEARLQLLEADFKRLGDITTKNKLALQDVTTRLEQSQSQRFANPLVYGLLLALLTCVAGIGFLWQKMRASVQGDIPWWGGADTAERAAADARQSLFHEEFADVQGGRALSKPPVTSLAVAEEPADASIAATLLDDVAPSSVAASPGTGFVDIDLEMGESVFSPASKLRTAAASVPASAAATTVSPQAPGNPEQVDFQPSISGVWRAVNTREMLDIRQQADFFMTLGRHDEAIHLLQTSIDNTDESNPLLYLDLLKIFHTLSRKTEFDKYRANFNNLFTGMVPEYATFNLAGVGLDAYSGVCRQIEALWPSDEVITFIERCLVRTPSEPLDAGFTVDAFHDLLMLHAVVRRIDAMAESGLVPFSAAAHTMPTSRATSPLPLIPTSISSGLDLDLSTGGGNLIDFDISDHALDPASTIDTLPPKH